MKVWLKEILDVMARLEDDDESAYILRDMLETSRRQRITAAELVKRLAYKGKGRQQQSNIRPNAGETAASRVSLVRLAKYPNHGSTTEEDTSFATDF